MPQHQGAVHAGYPSHSKAFWLQILGANIGDSVYPHDCRRSGAYVRIAEKVKSEIQWWSVTSLCIMVSMYLETRPAPNAP